jgi:hypothetical protein
LFGELIPTGQPPKPILCGKQRRGNDKEKVSFKRQGSDHFGMV